MSKFNHVLPINTDGAPKSIGHCSQAVAFSHYNNLSAQLPIDPGTGKLVVGDVRVQAEQCFRNIKAILGSIHHPMDDIVKVTLFLKNITDFDAVSLVYKTWFPDYVPALTTIAAAALPLGALIQVEALVSNGEGTIPDAPQAGDLVKIARNSENAPQSILSTQTVAFSHYNNLSAQLPIVPENGKLVSGGIKEQAVQCLNNIKSILKKIDVPFDDIVKINVFMTDAASIAAFNEVYTTFFPDSAIARTVGYFPARSIMIVPALLMDALVQVEAVISHGDGTPPQVTEDRHGIVIKPYNSAKAPIDAFSTQAVAFSHYSHITAQLPCLPESGKLVAGGLNAQTRQCLQNIKEIVESTGHSIADIVKINICLKNIDDMAVVDDVYTTFFPTGTPARRTLGVSWLPEDVLIQIEAVVSHAEGTAPDKP
ncbi:reactive intermediate/imine deaminase [Salmonella enterica]|uniref:Reactive intermediate/imine deaminase n=1 Tax=Salmonella newport TaxID=108619 RepID=A0A5U9VTN5_SALNE|nr:reactive intermediate/imine deaminase [Salmonella enterica subsp. enterica serovar Newport]ECB3300485.1 reactive intermediate/imine deaminase [Salmonella enterica subsp. enterica serovar Newport]EHI3123113.1 reactive intermediate/imine deaminase [Salmonella enterica]